MKFSIKTLTFFFIIQVLLSCALPSPEYENQTFVPKKDILANSIYQEGVELYKAGRMIDAELKLRQALYLYPQAENIKANLALILKSNSLFKEANDIYLDLIKRYPEAYDYQFALADSYYRERRFKEANRMYQKAMLGYETLPDFGKAAQAARSMASVYFLQGGEEDALCSSNEAHVYTPGQEQMIRHIRLLLATGYSQLADQSLSPLVQNTEEIKDPSLLKLSALVFFGDNKLAETKTFLDLAYESQTAGLKESDAELEILRRIIAYKYPEEKKEGEDEPEEKEEKEIVFNEHNLLYWPLNLVELYHEYMAEKAKEKD